MKYELRLDFINRFQRNSRIRLHIRDLYTEEERSIQIPTNAEALISDLFRLDVMSIEMMPSDTNGEYIVRLREAERRDYLGMTFSVNLEQNRFDLISRIAQYRSKFTLRMADRYSYRLTLINVYEREEVVDFYTLLTINDTQEGQIHRLYLPILPEDIEKIARTYQIIPRTFHEIEEVWVTMEPSEEGQFIVTTTPELSKEVTYVFLVDVEQNIAIMINN